MIEPLLQHLRRSMYPYHRVEPSMPLQVEAVYPVAEGLTTGVLTTVTARAELAISRARSLLTRRLKLFWLQVNNVGCLVFLLIQNIPNIGTAWMNWAVMAACLVSFLVITPLSERQKRLAFDLADEGTPAP